MNKLEMHIFKIINDKLDKNRFATPVDYFSWGRDSRHIVDDTEELPVVPDNDNLFVDSFKKIASLVIKGLLPKQVSIRYQFRKRYASFEKSYLLMSDQFSKNLFAELVLMKLVSEKNMRLSSFTQEFIHTYEKASGQILNSNDTLHVYKWVLRKMVLDNPGIVWFTEPTILNLHYSDRLYRYQRDEVCIEVEGGDIVIDAGVGWGDTTIYLAALANQKPSGHSYAFDILEDGMNALSQQHQLNPKVRNLTPVLKALSDKDGEYVYITSPSPGAKVVDEETECKIETVTIDTFSNENDLKSVDFIKMDIEGAEVPALNGAIQTIRKYKPKLAISIYHKWDDLLVIPLLINSIRDDYKYYIDCTTGFGGETILYCH